jgi:hypothetical protein
LGKIGQPFETRPNKDSQGKVHNLEGKISEVVRIDNQVNNLQHNSLISIDTYKFSLSSSETIKIFWEPNNTC